MDLELNVERIRELADIIENTPDERFDMEHFVAPVGPLTFGPYENVVDHMVETNWCGTSACIAGHAIIAFCDKEHAKDLIKTGWVSDEAADMLGLDEHQQEELFFANSMVRLGDITKQMAARTLRHLADTGDVVWNFEKETTDAE